MHHSSKNKIYSKRDKKKIIFYKEKENSLQVAIRDQIDASAKIYVEPPIEKKSYKHKKRIFFDVQEERQPASTGYNELLKSFDLNSEECKPCPDDELDSGNGNESDDIVLKNKRRKLEMLRLNNRLLNSSKIPKPLFRNSNVGSTPKKSGSNESGGGMETGEPRSKVIDKKTDSIQKSKISELKKILEKAPNSQLKGGKPDSSECIDQYSAGESLRKYEDIADGDSSSSSSSSSNISNSNISNSNISNSNISNSSIKDDDEETSNDNKIKDDDYYEDLEEMSQNQYMDENGYIKKDIIDSLDWGNEFDADLYDAINKGEIEWVEMDNNEEEEESDDNDEKKIDSKKKNKFETENTLNKHDCEGQPECIEHDENRISTIGENIENEFNIDESEILEVGDYYSKHFNYIIHPQIALELQESRSFYKFSDDPVLGSIWITKEVVNPIPKTVEHIPNEDSAAVFHLVKRLVNSWNVFKKELKDLRQKYDTEESMNLGTSEWANNENSPYILSKTELNMSDTQRHLFSVINSYRDVFYARRSAVDSIEIISTYCLHILNHILFTRGIIERNNRILSKFKKDQDGISRQIRLLSKQLRNLPASTTSEQIYSIKEERKTLNKKMDESPPELRDQGFTRPSVLVLFPMRNGALEFFECLQFLSNPYEKIKVKNRARFYEEFYDGNSPDIKHHSKEWCNTFRGSVDDDFCLGIQLTPSGVLIPYSDLYHCDIILASPLGLRLAIERAKDSPDYLSSLEIVIADQMDVIHMQNWDHIEFIFKKMSHIPEKPRETDFSRVKMQILNGHAKFYRQTILLGNYQTADFNSLFNRLSFNWDGKIKIRDFLEKGSVDDVFVPVQQVMQRFSSNLENLEDRRLEYFETHVYPHIRSSISGGILLFVPSYFDFLRLKLFLKRSFDDDISIVYCSEYTSKNMVKKNARAFLRGEAKVLVVTERFHFYNERRFIGSRTVIFYSPPFHASYYSQILNWLPSDGFSLLIYTSYDLLQIEGIVGIEKAHMMLSSQKNKFSIQI